MDTKIIYIIGTGRSGTTLLDIILGNGVNLFSAGELNRYTKRNGMPHSPRDADVELFWKGVKDELIQSGFPEPEILYKKFQKFEYHKWFYNIWNSGIFKSKDYKLYSAYQRQLFDIIGKKLKLRGEKSIIIDSSKYPLRGYFLSFIFQNQISFIYINRQPTDVVYSFQKKDVEQPAKNRFFAHLYLLVVNILCKMVIRRIKPRCKVSAITFNDLLEFPGTTLSKIEEELGLDLSIPQQQIAGHQPLLVGSLFDGNRLRLKTSIVFKAADESSSKNKNIFDRLMMPVHRLLWYSK